MKNEFVPYELALELKQLGFDEPCIAHFRGFDCEPTCQMGFDFKFEKNSEFGNSNYWIARPTFSTAFRWFREKHNIDGLLHKTVEGSYYFWITECEYENYNHYKYYNQMVYFNTYEKAELECLIKLIEIIKNGTK